MHSAGEPVGWDPLRHCTRFEKGAIDPLRLGSKYPMESNDSVGHGTPGMIVICGLANAGAEMPYAMRSMLGGIFTQVCIRSSYTEMDGLGNVGSAKAPTGMAMFSTS